MINTISEHGSGASVRTTRREFLQSTAMGAVGVSVAATSPRHANLRAVRGQACRAVILILNVGGPSQLDTWDPKPDAPEEIRGPFRAIQTSVPGIAVSELFPRHAVIAHHLAFVRSCHHRAPAVHEVGWQLAQTGCDFSPDVPMPHVGQVASRLLAQPERVPQHAVLPAVVRKRHRRLPTGQTSESGVCPAKNAWGRAVGCHARVRRGEAALWSNPLRRKLPGGTTPGRDRCSVRNDQHQLGRFRARLMGRAWYTSLRYRRRNEADFRPGIRSSLLRPDRGSRRT